MKRAVCEQVRMVPSEEKKLELYRLPPVVSQPPAPQQGLVDVTSDRLSVYQMTRILASQHWSSYANTCSVLLHLQSTWSKFADQSLIDSALNSTTSKLPMTLYEYQDKQEDYFSILRDKVWELPLLSCILLRLRFSLSCPELLSSNCRFSPTGGRH